MDSCNHRPLLLAISLALLTGETVTLCAADSLKAICAVKAATPPVIDGVLEETCWKTAEVREDFDYLGTPQPRRTTVRCAYDETHLYLGVECFGDDSEALRRSIAALKEKQSGAGGWTSIDDFVNQCSIELFLDPGVSMRNHYQILFNVARRICGSYRSNFNHPFTSRPAFKAAALEKGWSAELIFPVQDGTRLAPGDEWGINFVRNDESPFSMWRLIHGAFNEPKMFGRLIIGSYEEWWEAVWTRGAAAKLARIQKDAAFCWKDGPTTEALYRLVLKRAQHVEEVRRTHPPNNRENFETLYRTYAEFERLFERLDGECRTRKLMRST